MAVLDRAAEWHRGALSFVFTDSAGAHEQAPPSASESACSMRSCPVGSRRIAGLPSCAAAGWSCGRRVAPRPTCRSRGTSTVLPLWGGMECSPMLGSSAHAAGSSWLESRARVAWERRGRCEMRPRLLESRCEREGGCEISRLMPCSSSCRDATCGKCMCTVPSRSACRRTASSWRLSKSLPLFTPCHHSGTKDGPDGGECRRRRAARAATRSRVLLCPKGASPTLRIAATRRSMLALRHGGPLSAMAISR